MRFLADENFDNGILRGVLREHPELEMIRVQDTEIYGADDPTVLEWAAQAECILLNHDLKTMPGYVSRRVAMGLRMPGIILVLRQTPIGQAISELLIVIGASVAAEHENQVVYLPFR